jgi:hypothetical protein
MPSGSQRQLKSAVYHLLLAAADLTDCADTTGDPLVKLAADVAGNLANALRFGPQHTLTALATQFDAANRRTTT